MVTVKDILEQFENGKQTKPDLIQIRLENNNVYLECDFNSHKHFRKDLLNRRVLTYSTLRTCEGRLLTMYIEE